MNTIKINYYSFVYAISDQSTCLLMSDQVENTAKTINYNIGNVLLREAQKR